LKKLIKNKIFVLVTINVILSIVLSLTFVFAWYLMNVKVQQSGMKLRAKVVPSLVITSDQNKIGKLSLDDTGSFFIEDSFPSKRPFLPCTHYFENETDTPFPYLSYLDNTSEVDRDTGLVDNPILKTVSSELAQYYYVSKTVYIGAANQEFADSKLVVSFDFTSPDSKSGYKDDSGTTSTKNDNVYQAASIDFYVNSQFKGTLNVAGLDSNNSLTAKKELVIFSGSILQTDYLEVTMVMYFDGALKKNENLAYVNSATVTGDNAVIDVLFEVRQ